MVMDYNRIQRLFIKLFKPVISLSEEPDKNKRYILVGNHIGKYDPVLISLINGNIKFLLQEDSFFYRDLNKTIIDLSNNNIENLRKAFVETVDSNISCVFPLNKDNEIEKNNYYELLLRSQKYIIPFAIKGSYKIDDDLILKLGQSFLASDYNVDLQQKINSEVKKLIR